MINEDLVTRKLDLILRVLSLQVGADRSITERIRLLKIAGLDNQTIAEVLGTTTATVRTLGSNLHVRRRSQTGGRKATAKRRTRR